LKINTLLFPRIPPATRRFPKVPGNAVTATKPAYLLKNRDTGGSKSGFSVVRNNNWTINGPRFWRPFAGQQSQYSRTSW
jgi:hypothetical protein